MSTTDLHEAPQTINPSEADLDAHATLHRQQTQDRLIATLDLVDANTAGEKLGIPKDDIPAALRQQEEQGELICVDRDGQPFYPLFQFEPHAPRVHLAVVAVLALCPPHWSPLRLCYWMTRAHTDFGRPPAELLGIADADILEAFQRATMPDTHG